MTPFPNIVLQHPDRLEYGVTSHGSGDYEVDHLIPLELGGSNSIKNLWPESHRTLPWNAQVKDRLEGRLDEFVFLADSERFAPSFER